jgi:hypothetical protein
MIEDVTVVSAYLLGVVREPDRQQPGLVVEHRDDGEGLFQLLLLREAPALRTERMTECLSVVSIHRQSASAAPVLAGSLRHRDPMPTVPQETGTWSRRSDASAGSSNTSLAGEPGEAPRSFAHTSGGSGAVTPSW